jgi:O-antigen/teichoic acid export membrane protein
VTDIGGRLPDTPPEMPPLGPSHVSRRDAEIRKRVLLSTTTNILGTGFRLLVWLFLTPFILGLLGPVAYGVWVVVGSLAAYGTLLDLGLTPALVKYVAEHVARDDIGEVNRVVGTALWLSLGQGLLAFGLAILLSPVVPGFLSVPPGQAETTSVVVVLTGLSLGIGIPASAAPSTLMGLQRYDLVNGIYAISTLVGAAVTVIVLYAGGGLVGMVAATIPVLILTTLMNVFAIHKVRPDLAPSLRSVDRHDFRSILTYSSSSFAYQVSGVLQSKSDEVIVGRFLGVALVTPYSIGRRVSELVPLFTQQFMKVLLPLASQLHAEGDAARLQAVYLTGTRLAMALSFPIGVTVLVLAEPFIRAWVGPAFLPAVPITIVLTVSSMVALTQWPAGAIFQGMARHRPLAIGALLTGIANIVLSVVLVQQIGLLGAAVGTLIPTALESLFFVLPYATRRLGIRLVDVVRNCLIPAGLPLIPCLAVAIGLRLAIEPSSVWSVAAIGAAATLTYFVAYLFLGAGPLERDLVRVVLGRINRWMRRSSPS